MTHEQFLGYLIPFFGIMATVAGVLFWRQFTRMENKIDEWAKNCRDCKKELVTKKELDDWKSGRKELKDDLWDRVNHHRHDDEGKVVIT